MEYLPNSFRFFQDNVIVASTKGIAGGSAADPKIGFIANNVIRDASNAAVFLNPCVGVLVTANMLTQFPGLANQDGSCVAVDNALQQ